MTQQAEVCCIGQAVSVHFLHVEHYPLRGSSVPIRSVLSIAGNDAYIVASMLAKRGVVTTLWSNPVARQLVAHGRALKLSSKLLLAHLSDEANAPPNYCIYEIDGTRTWLPTHVEIQNPLDIHNLEGYRYIYADYYDELVNTMTPVLHNRQDLCPRVLLNLSTTDISQKLRALSGLESIFAVQLSIGPDVAKAEKIAAQIAEHLKPTLVICTLAELGSLIRRGSTQMHVPAPKVVNRQNGAGAVFSAAFLHALLKQMDVYAAHALAVEHATEFCSNELNPLDLQKFMNGQS